MVLVDQNIRIRLRQNRFWNTFIISHTITRVAETPGFLQINASDPEPIASVGTMMICSPRGIRATVFRSAVLLFVHASAINFNGSLGTETSCSANKKAPMAFAVFTTIGTGWSTFKVYLVAAASRDLSFSY